MAGMDLRNPKAIRKLSICNLENKATKMLLRPSPTGRQPGSRRVGQEPRRGLRGPLREWRDSFYRTA